MTQKDEPTISIGGSEVRGKVKNYKVEIVIKNADGTVKERRVEMVSKAV